MPTKTLQTSSTQTDPREGGGVVLAVKDLSVSLTNRTILKGVSFEVPANASLAVIGPNGSGKTVLLKALLGLLPYQGTIRWRAGPRLGYVPQNISADRHFPLRARELLYAKARVQHLAEQEVESAVEWVGIQELLDRWLGALSSGQLQRVLIAFALIGAPTVLLVDEPTSSLDELAEERVFELLQRIRRERSATVILVSHDLTLVQGAATHVLCLCAGRASFGRAAEMLTPEVLERVYGHPVEVHLHKLEQKP